MQESGASGATNQQPQGIAFKLRQSECLRSEATTNSLKKKFDLALQLQFAFEMGFARVGLMSPAPGRPCEDVGVRDAPLS
jgi:hypothetical protein